MCTWILPLWSLVCCLWMHHSLQTHWTKGSLVSPWHSCENKALHNIVTRFLYSLPFGFNLHLQYWHWNIVNIMIIVTKMILVISVLFKCAEEMFKQYWYTNWYNQHKSSICNSSHIKIVHLVSSWHSCENEAHHNIHNITKRFQTANNLYNKIIKEQIQNLKQF